MRRNALYELLKIHEKDKKEHPEKYAPRPETLESGYDPTNDPLSPFYQGAHEAPMVQERKLNLVQLASLGIDIDLLLAGKTQF